MKPLFRNDKEYTIQIATPSGAGRGIPTGFYVEGDYFLDSWRQGTPITKVNGQEAESIDRSLILLSISTDENGKFPQESRTLNLEKDTVGKPIPEYKLEEPKKDLEQVFAEAMGEVNKLMPTPSELEKMSSEALVKLATKYGISGSGNRQSLIQLLKAKITK